MGAEHPAPFGMRHHPLAEFLTAFIGAGLEIEHVAEMGDRPVPHRSRHPCPHEHPP